MVVLDGAGDRPGSGPTPLEMAETPFLDGFVSTGSLGQLHTVGKGVAPESDAGVFSLLGYDPLRTHLSRGIVEALGADVRFDDGDLALRAGFAAVKGDKLVDRRAGRDLSTDEAVQLGTALNKELRLKERTPFEFKPTVGHRAVLVFRPGQHRFSSNISNFDPAYVRQGNISIAQAGKGPYELPKCEPLDGSPEAAVTSALVNEFGYKARSILDRHPVNKERRKRGQLPANFVLMRDAGTTKPLVQSFGEKWGLSSVMVADLPAEIGIGRLLEMSVERLAPGNSLEDYRKRGKLVLDLSRKYGFVYVHLKGPDEPGHDGLDLEKSRRISDIDAGFFSVLARAGLKEALLCVTCDHSTPWKDQGHSDDPVPVLITGAGTKSDGVRRFTEVMGAKGSLGTLDQGRDLTERLVKISKEWARSPL